MYVVKKNWRNDELQIDANKNMWLLSPATPNKDFDVVGGHHVVLPASKLMLRTSDPVLHADCADTLSR